MDKAGDVIFCDNKAKNTGIAVAMTRLFNAVSVQKNKPEWLSYFMTMPKVLGLERSNSRLAKSENKGVPIHRDDCFYDERNAEVGLSRQTRIKTL